jgi:hypothetical protein
MRSLWTLVFACALQSAPGEDGSGVFRAPWRIPDPMPAAGFAAGDFDRDGLRDLAAVHGSGPVAVFLGVSGGPGRWRRTDIQDDTGIFAVELAIADGDGDGMIDLVAGGPQGAVVHFGEGGGAFGLPAPLAQEAGLDPADPGAADIDGDGTQDIVLAPASTSAIAVLQGKGGRAWSPPRLLVHSAPAETLAIADIDGDGRADIVAASHMGPWISVLRGLGGGDFGPVAENSVPFLGAGLRLADLDLDGSLDLADPIAVLERLFLGGAPLPPPGGVCGPDPTPDDLPCFAGCRGEFHHGGRTVGGWRTDRRRTAG